MTKKQRLRLLWYKLDQEAYWIRIYYQTETIKERIFPYTSSAPTRIHDYTDPISITYET